MYGVLMQHVHIDRDVAIVDMEGCRTPIFRFLAHLPNIDSARQRWIVDKTQIESYLWANWARTKSVCRQIEVVKCL